MHGTGSRQFQAAPAPASPSSSWNPPQPLPRRHLSLQLEDAERRFAWLCQDVPRAPEEKPLSPTPTMASYCFQVSPLSSTSYLCKAAMPNCSGTRTKSWKQKQTSAALSAKCFGFIWHAVFWGVLRSSEVFRGVLSLSRGTKRVHGTDHASNSAHGTPHSTRAFWNTLANRSKRVQSLNHSWNIQNPKCFTP